LHEHGRGGLDHDPKHLGSYEADQSRLGEIGNQVMLAHVTKDGRTSRDLGYTPKFSARENIMDSPEGRATSVSMTTPEGHRLSTEHVQGIMSGTHDAQELREYYADQHEVTQQQEFEHRAKQYIGRNKSLPHSGIDAMMAGVPTADSAAGMAISSGTMPHYSGDTSLENPAVAVGNKRRAAYQDRVSASVPKNRAEDRGRIVDHR
jgi:hypothetical protein